MKRSIKLLRPMQRILLLLCAGYAQAATLNFAALSQPGSSYVNLGTSYTQQGFQFLDSRDSDTGNGFSAWQAASPNLPGLAPANTSLFEYYEFSTTVLTQAANSAFTLSSIDLAQYNNQQSAGSFPVTFKGTRADGTVVTQTVTVNRSSSKPALETFKLTDFTNVVRVSFQQGSNAIGNAYQFNNLVVGPAASAIVHAASFAATSLSPGLIFTIQGLGLGPVVGQSLVLDASGRVANVLSNVQVMVDGVAVPLLYVSSTQINAVAPYELSAKKGQSVNVQVIYNGVAGNVLAATVADTAPGIFQNTNGQNTNGQGAILNQDLTYNASATPAAKGSYVSIFCTGEGLTNPLVADGHVSNEPVAMLARPLAQVSVTIGGVPVPPSDLYYAGAAPQVVAGVFEVIARIPLDAGSGTQPILVTVGSQSSQKGVTVAVQ